MSKIWNRNKMFRNHNTANVCRLLFTLHQAIYTVQCAVCLDQIDPCSCLLQLMHTTTICSRSRVRPKMTRSGKWSRKGTTAAAATTPAAGAELDNSKVGQRETAQDWNQHRFLWILPRFAPQLSKNLPFLFSLRFSSACLSGLRSQSRIRMDPCYF